MGFVLFFFFVFFSLAMMVMGDGGLPVGFGRPAMKKKQVLFFFWQ